MNYVQKLFQIFTLYLFTTVVVFYCGGNVLIAQEGKAQKGSNEGYLFLDHGRIGQVNPIIPKGIDHVAAQKKDGWAIGFGLGYRFEMLAVEAFYRSFGKVSYNVPGYYHESLKSNALGQGIRFWYSWLSLTAGILSVRSERNTTSEAGSSNTVTRDNMEKSWTSSGYYVGAGVSMDLASSIDLFMDIAYYTWGGDSENVTVVSGPNTHTSKTADRNKFLEFLLGLRIYL